MSAVVDNTALAQERSPAPWLEEVTRTWKQVLADKSLADLPYKIETNRSGQIVMSPAKNIHGAYQTHIAARLEAALGGKTVAECAIATPAGVKVADVAWLSEACLSKHGYADPYPIAPELCVQIKSPSNTMAELLAKVRLYLDAGAKEVWLVADDGTITFYDASGPIARSSFNVDVPPLK